MTTGAYPLSVPTTMNQSITVNGYNVRLRPYTEKRRSELIAINDEISDYAKDAPHWDEIPEDVKHGFWSRKAHVLWDCEIPSDMYKSEYFEYEALMETERFFLSRQDGRSKRLNFTLVRPTTTQVKRNRAARNESGSTASGLTNIKATCLPILIQSWPCRYGINLPISLQRPW